MKDVNTKIENYSQFLLAANWQRQSLIQNIRVTINYQNLLLN